MNLVNLTHLWKDGKVLDKEVKNIYKNIKIFEPYKIGDDWFYTCVDNNSWLDVYSDGYLSREERMEFKKLIYSL